jgi:hypothetical protein
MDTAEQLCSESYKALFSCSGLSAIRDRRLTTTQCAYVLRQYQRYVQGFPKFLALGLSKLDDDEARLPLVGNLWDEHGEGDLSKAHRNLYKGLIEKVLETSPQTATLLKCEYKDAIVKFVSECEAALSGGSAAFAMGFLGPGTEGTTAELYAILPRLLHPFDLEGEDDFFAPHCLLDVDHAKLFAPAIEIVLRSNVPNARREYVEGAKTALDLERDFWNNVVQEAQRL